MIDFKKFAAFGAVFVMIAVAFAGISFVSEEADASATTYGSSENPLTSVDYTLAFNGADAGSVWYVKTGSYVSFTPYRDDGGSEEFGSYVSSVTSGFGLNSDGCGRLYKPGTVTLNCKWWNGGLGANFTLTVIGVGEEYYSHTLSYNSNGGTGTASDTVYWSTTNGDITVTAGSGFGITKQGYYIKSWNTTASGNGTPYAVGASVPVSKNGTITLYAQWAVDERNGTADRPLESLSVGLDGVGDQTYYLAVGSTVDIRGFSDEPEGIYWNDGEGLGLTHYSQGTGAGEYEVFGLHGTVSQAGTLVTHWYYVTDPEGNYDSTVTVTIIAVKTYAHTIAYAGNGNTSGTTANTVVTASGTDAVNVTLATNGFTKTGYTFTGWLVNGTVYQPGATISVAADATVTATAQWSQNTVSASVNSAEGLSGDKCTTKISATANNGGTLSYAVKSVTGGSASIDSSGLVTYTCPTVTSTTTYYVTVTVTGTFSDGSTVSKNVSFDVLVDPILDFTNAVTDGSLTVKGA